MVWEFLEQFFPFRSTKDSELLSFARKQVTQKLALKEKVLIFNIVCLLIYEQEYVYSIFTGNM